MGIIVPLKEGLLLKCSKTDGGVVRQHSGHAGLKDSVLLPFLESK
jgi:hypothetical protein